jgi:hypothetical protein
MQKREPGWITDAHRKLAEAEKARYRWLGETSQWHVNGDPHKTTPIGAKSKVAIAVIVLLLMQLMWQRSTVDSPVTDEMIGMDAKPSRHH